MTAERRELKPASTAIAAGRSASGSALAPALWASSVWESTCLDDAHRADEDLDACAAILRRDRAVLCRKGIAEQPAEHGLDLGFHGR